MSRRTGRLLQLRRPTKANITGAAAGDFAAGEPSMASDTFEMFVSDGTTQYSVSRSFNGVGNPGSGNVVMPWNTLTIATNTSSLSGNLALLPVDIWPAPLSIKALVCSVTTAQSGGTGTLTNAVLYRDNGTGSAPLVTTAGLLANVAVTATSTGIKLTTVSLTLTPGRYWAGMLYYAGSTAPSTAPVFSNQSTGSALWTPSTAFTVNKGLVRTGLTAVPTDSVAFVPSNSSQMILVGLQAA